MTDTSSWNRQNPNLPPIQGKDLHIFGSKSRDLRQSISGLYVYANTTPVPSASTRAALRQPRAQWQVSRNPNSPYRNQQLFLLDFDLRTRTLMKNLRNGPGVFAKEFRSLLSLAAYQDIVPEIQIRTPTRRWSRRNPKLRFSVYVNTRLEETIITQGGVPQGNYVPWWGFIIESGSSPHRLGKGGVGGGFHPGFAPTRQFKRGLDAGVPRFERTVVLGVNEYMRWLSRIPSRTGRYTSEVGVQQAHRKDMDVLWKRARRRSVQARKLSLRSTSGNRFQSMLPGMERVGSNI